MKQRTVNFPQNVPFGTTHFEHGRTFEYVEPGMWKSVGGSGGGTGGGGGNWEVINKSGHNCEYNHAYIVNIPTSNPYINLPKLGVDEVGQYVLISDGGDGWSTASNALTVNLNGPLQGQNVSQLSLDLANVTVTFVWDGASWWVYSSMSNTGVDEHVTDAPEDGKIYCRQDGTWVLLPPEEDPTVPDYVKGITQADIDRWNSEEDPTVPDHVKAITEQDINRWNAGGGGTGGPADWPDITNKPQPIKDLAAENATKVSIVSGGSY